MSSLSENNIAGHSDTMNLGEDKVGDLPRKNSTKILGEEMKNAQDKRANLSE